MRWFTLLFNELTLGQLYDIGQLRQEIFVVEQRSIYVDFDGKDKVATHLFCEDKGDLLAYQRCLPPGVSYPESSLGRILVHPRARGHQLGRELVQRGIDHNRLQWPDQDICISAQAHLQDFYASLDFVAEGEEYQEDNIPHRKMRLGR